jgi:DNA-binding transcriptional regulator YiaG
MKTKLEEFEVPVPAIDGSVAETVKVEVPLCWDEELGEWLLTPEAHEKIENTKARHMGLLSPAQLKELRKRFKFSQREMGELFQVGEKSWTRWESGKQRPSRAMNLLIRALYDGEISINYLLKKAGKKPDQEECQVFVSHEWPKHFVENAVRFAPMGNLAHEHVVVNFGAAEPEQWLSMRLNERTQPNFLNCFQIISNKLAAKRESERKGSKTPERRFEIPSEA